MKIAKTITALSIAALALSSCKSDTPEAKSEPAAEATPEATPAEAETKASGEASGETSGETSGTGELDRLLKWMPSEPLAVSWDRLGQRLDPTTLAVVFGVPPKAAHLLDERDTLDEALPLVFEGETDSSIWLSPTSFAFTIALSRSPYFVRPLQKPAAEVAGLLATAGFTKNMIEGTELWLPSGSFPWRIALLEGDVALFIPMDIPGAGLEAVLQHDHDGETGGDTGGEPEPSQPEPAAAKAAVEAELRTALTNDPMIELVLISSGPLASYDVEQPIAQVQFALRRTGSMSTPAYEGQVVLAPTGDPDECANALRARKYPEENQQVQALIAGVQFAVAERTVIGRLEIPADQVKHFLSR